MVQKSAPSPSSNLISLNFLPTPPIFLGAPYNASVHRKQLSRQSALVKYRRDFHTAYGHDDKESGFLALKFLMELMKFSIRGFESK